MRITADAQNPAVVPLGADLHLVPDEPVAVFAASILAGNINAGGEMKAHLLVPFDQVPNLMPVFQYVGGITFKITVERVDRDDLPEGGW